MSVKRWVACLFLAVAAGSAHGKTVVVAQDGTGDVRTVQEAVAAVPDYAQEETVIRIKAGTYQGPILVPKSKTHVTFEGEGVEKTILTWDRNVQDPIPPGWDKFNPGVHVLGEDFRAWHLTIQNTSGDHGQALALRIDSDRAAVTNCRILGWQDTLMVNNGRQYFRECHIEGRVDFIYGSGTAVFDRCRIHSKNGGYVTAASTPQEKPYGFVFLRCRLTGEATPWDPAATNPATTQAARAPNKMTYLGRPWRDFAAVAFIGCEMGDHIRPEGWHNWGRPEREGTSRYVEFGSTGPAGDLSKRVTWAKRLTREEAERVTVREVLAGKDGWEPEKE